VAPKLSQRCQRQQVDGLELDATLLQQARVFEDALDERRQPRHVAAHHAEVLLAFLRRARSMVTVSIAPLRSGSRQRTDRPADMRGPLLEFARDQIEATLAQLKMIDSRERLVERTVERASRFDGDMARRLLRLV
jgi:hypothetical protein